MTTSTGLLARYDVQAEQLLTPFAVGNALNGADLSPDGQFLYVAENQVTMTQGFVHKVNLDDGTVTDLAYDRSGAEPGPWDLAVAGNGLAFFTTGYSGSGATVLLHQIDLATDTLSTRMQVFPTALLTHGADASLLFGVQPTASQGPIFTYDAAADSFHNANTAPGFNNDLSAVNRDGSLVAMEFQGGLSVMDRDLHTIQILGGLSGGVAFDPTQDILYGASPATNQIIAYDTNTWHELYRVAIGETIGSGSPFGSGEMTVSDDSSELFLSTPSGVRMIDLPPATGQPAQLKVSGFPSYIGAGTVGTFTVTATDPAGYSVPGFTGTVHFESTDAKASLPEDYTFTPDDQGVHTFQAILSSNGTFSLTATDAADDLSGGQAGIQVHTASSALIPVANRRDLVWDASRGILYITTGDGSVQRYDPATQTLLAPFRVGASPQGADITTTSSSTWPTASRGRPGGWCAKSTSTTAR
jgi:sugar lactone lactonase YvrE